MSFPLNNNPLLLAIKELEDVVIRNQGDDHEAIDMVREMEAIVTDIERKSATLQIQRSVTSIPRPVHAV